MTGVDGCPAAQARAGYGSPIEFFQRMVHDPPTTAGAAHVERVLSSLSGRIEPVRVGPLYRLGLVLVAVAMVLLPLIYVGLIALVAYGLWWHATEHTSVFAGARGRSARGALMAYAVPLVVGGILLFFMVKPLFARRGRAARPLRLQPDVEPLLFRYVAHVCRAVGAPTPREICVDCEVNASASFRRGVWSFLWSDLTLTIGLPLVVGLSLRQFSGVLAHEFGHFTQGFGMRSTYVIRSINGWFHRVVYERDAWDERLAAWSSGGDLRVMVPLLVARVFVWLTRRVLWCLMWVGHLISCFMLREMEFDADRHEARLAGSETFAATQARLREIGLAHHAALDDVSTAWEEGRLADDLPELVRQRLEELPAEVRQQLARMGDEMRTGMFDTHPADADRVASAQREAAAGLFQWNGEGVPSASILFADIGGLSRAASWEFYQVALGSQAQRSALRPSAELASRRAADQVAAQALGRFCQGQLSGLRPWPLADAAMPRADDVESLLATIRTGRDRAMVARASYRRAFQRFDEADSEFLAAIQARSLLQAGLTFAPQQFRLSRASSAEADALHQRARGAMAAAEPELSSVEQTLAARLLAALVLLQRDEVQQRVEQGAALAQEAAWLLPVLRTVNREMNALFGLRERQHELMALCGQLREHESREGLVNAIRGKMNQLRLLLIALHQQLAQTPYPF